MQGGETVVEADQALSESWEEFFSQFLQLVPGLEVSATRETTLAELLSADRITKGHAAAAVQHLLFNPPDDLVTPDMTLGELYEWRCVRAHPVDTHPTNARLRPIRDTDIPTLHQAAIDPRWSHHWRFRGATPGPEEFIAQLHQGVLAQFIIETKRTRRAIGLVVCYNARPDLGWAYIAFTRIASPGPEGETGSEMLEGAYLFISFLFSRWNLRKLYAEVPGWNWEMFAKGAGPFFEVEGVLHEHDYYDGRYWDHRIVALYRERWASGALSPLSQLIGNEMP